MEARLEQQLSLETVTWGRRITAILIAFIIGATLLPPIADICQVFHLRPGLYSVFPLAYGRIWMMFYLAPLLGLGSLLAWGLPALVLTHIALRWSWPFWTYVPGGALTGALGSMMINETYYIIWEPNDVMHWLFYLPIVLPSGLTGAVCAVAAWYVMAFGQWDRQEQR